MAALALFQCSSNSRRICGLALAPEEDEEDEDPLARHRIFLSLSAYHLFRPFSIRSRGKASLPRNSNL